MERAVAIDLAESRSERPRQTGSWGDSEFNPDDDHKRM
jgi:hypothetical protein